MSEEKGSDMKKSAASTQLSNLKARAEKLGCEFVVIGRNKYVLAGGPYYYVDGEDECVVFSSLAKVKAALSAAERVQRARCGLNGPEPA